MGSGTWTQVPRLVFNHCAMQSEFPHSVKQRLATLFVGPGSAQLRLCGDIVSVATIQLCIWNVKIVNKQTASCQARAAWELHAHICTCWVCVTLCVGQRSASVGCLPLSLSSLFFETGYQAHWVAKVARQQVPRICLSSLRSRCMPHLTDFLHILHVLGIWTQVFILAQWSLYLLSHLLRSHNKIPSNIQERGERLWEWIKARCGSSHLQPLHLGAVKKMP